MKYLRSALAAAAVLFSTAAHAEFPDKPVTLVVPFAAGGSNDILARYVGDRLGKAWGQPVVITNMPGAGAAIGSAHVSQAAPDGYTLLIASVTFTMNPAVQPNLPFDPKEGFQPVAMLGKVPLVLVVGKSLEANTVQEFVATAKGRELAYATSGLGTVNQFGAELFAQSAGIKMTPVHYKGGSEAMTDVIGGHVDSFMSSMTQALPMIRGGQMRGLVVTSTERSAAVPDIPTTNEAGIPGVDVEQWWGILAPAKTPADIVEKLNADINAILSTQETKDFLAKDAGRPTPMSVQEFTDLINSELDKWRGIAEKADIKAE
ncbi:tripartite-type tricarboxylate transporter receptor subunit TctC [Mycoplana sp. BE70]|uniref:Bug family tripartite tricarboxylate transporter substrate binding protein n=1 Tax=Mycoplana sp. BE70 TaxID=2817775 RepID=UPI00285FA9CB|nr:tripartite tricarboxylate transporter substrate binding protein [Mycoplana sp. BE70]MDR6756418.1 tripartite-type tricarboxylate transporter receptor subunit TctC [Mycoplana sp. BE70]